MPSRRGGGAASQAGIGKAPGDLATLQAFVNTLDIEQGAELLSTPASCDQWLQEAGLLAGNGRARSSDLATAVELREALRGVLRSHVADLSSVPSGPAEPSGAAEPAGPAASSSTEAASRVGAVAAALQARLDVDTSGRVVVAPAGTGTDAALTRLLVIAAEAATLGTWARLKVCSADDCQWAFYDRSPTRTGCWCSMQICGSRAKSRAYRGRAARVAQPLGRM
jgi:predicted RNA-binding Zn ribbon-like protein